MSDFWNSEDEVSEFDLIEEARETEALAETYANEPMMIEADDDELDEIAEESAFNLDRSESSVIYNARIRLEQAKLYELLINHNLFEGVDADERAIEVVQNEIKHYIVKRLQILMGMRQPKPAAPVPARELPLNSVEIEFLKELSYKGTKGRSVDAPEIREEVVAKKSGLNPVAAAKKTNNLKTFQKSEARRPQETVVPERAAAPAKKQPQKTQGRSVKVSSSVSERSLNAREVEALAREDIENMKGRKPFHKMTAKEKAEEIKAVNERHARNKKASNSLPMMDPEALRIKYMTEQSTRASNIGNKNPFDAILSNVAEKIASGELKSNK